MYQEDVGSKISSRIVSSISILNVINIFEYKGHHTGLDPASSKKKASKHWIPAFAGITQ